MCGTCFVLQSNWYYTTELWVSFLLLHSFACLVSRTAHTFSPLPPLLLSNPASHFLHFINFSPTLLSLQSSLISHLTPLPSLTPSPLFSHTLINTILHYRRALDLIFVLVDENNSEEVVGELVASLASAQSVLKEDMVVKIAILAEKYSSGAYVTEVWRVVRGRGIGWYKVFRRVVGGLVQGGIV